jgi:hypothetical protein
MQMRQVAATDCTICNAALGERRCEGAGLELLTADELQCRV